MKSPCIGCDFEHEDKNNDRCVNCEQRIKYAEDEFMIPTEALEADRAVREETQKIREMKPPGKKKGPKAKKEMEIEHKPSKEKVVLGRHRKPKGRYHDRYNLRIGPRQTDDRVAKALEELWKIAALEYRKPSSQAIIFISEGIDKWKKEHGAP